MTTWAVIPVRDFRRGKSRLAPILSPDERVAYARSLFDGVLAAAASSAAIDRVLVASDAPAGDFGACDVLLDPPDASLATIVDRALAHARERGARRAIVLMSDLPRITAADIDELVAAAAGHSLVAVPDRHERGTNALAIALPAPAPTRFGNADSFDRHRSIAGCAVHRNRNLAFDVDTPEDLAEEALSISAGQPAGTSGRGSRSP